MGNFYTTKQIADFCGVHISTAIRWIDAGQLRGFRTPGGRRRVTKDDLRQFLKRLRMPLPDTLSRRPTVVVVNDRASRLRSVWRRLTSRFEVLPSESAYDALVSLGAARPDAVVVDLSMRDLDGFAVCASIKRNESTRKVAVIAVSDDTTEELGKRARRFGADAWLSRRDARALLADTIESALESPR